MAILNGCYTITARDIADGSATVATGHTSIGGEATCQTIKAKNPFAANLRQAAIDAGKDVPSGLQAMVDRPNINRPQLRPLSPITVANGDLVVPIQGLNAGERICWLSWES